MRRIFGDFAYGDGPRNGCWWDETCPAPVWPKLQGDIKADVAIVGGGYTGLSAALHLAQAGASVVVLEAQTPGFGASGRNGGFCCQGGGVLDDAMLRRRYGREAAEAYRQAEIDAIDLVDGLIRRHDMQVDRHSKGETVLAHSPRAMQSLKFEAETKGSAWIDGTGLAGAGLGGAFHGAMTRPHGFALNPRKYLFALARAAQDAGAQLFQNSPATHVATGCVVTSHARVRAPDIVIATNGYSSEDLPKALAARYLPVQSNVLVTRPLSADEIEAQGWHSDQMSYDTRRLLHYFRLMPDRRFLFGMRGGLLSSPRAEARARARTLRDFRAMFPHWAHVDVPHLWSGLVCMSAAGQPFVGALPGTQGLYGALAYHGNGLAMSSYCGARLAGLLTGADTIPESMQTIPRFPLGRFRRALLPPLYLCMRIIDAA